MKRVVVLVSAAVTAVVALLPGAAAKAASPSGYSVSPIVLSMAVSGLAVDPSRNLIYIGGYGQVGGTGSIQVIDAASEAVAATVPVPARPYELAVDPATNTIYAATSDGITAIDGATDEAITTIPAVGHFAADPSTDTVYASATAPGGGPGVAVIDGATNSITDTIALPGTASVSSIAVDPSTDTIYVGTADGTLAAIDGASNTITGSVTLGVYRILSLAVDPDTDSVYVVMEGTNAVDVVNATTLTVSASLTGCSGEPAALAADPATNAIFESSVVDATTDPEGVTCVIDAATNALADTFPRSGTVIATNSATGAAYIGGYSPYGYIWVASPSTTNALSPMTYGFGGWAKSSSVTLAVGVKASDPLLVSALPAATVTETGALPAGITMSSAGAFSGTPAAGTVGTYPVSVTASNGIAPDNTVSLTLVVYIAPAVVVPPEPILRTGVNRSFTVSATGDPAPTLDVIDGPSWLTFTINGTSAVFSGTPPRGSGGYYNFYVWATSEYGTSPNQLVEFVVHQPPAVIAASRLTFRNGQRVRYRLMATGVPAPVMVRHGNLPPGLHFHADPGTALITGKPHRGDVGRTYRITITASNKIGHQARKTITIRISKAS